MGTKMKEKKVVIGILAHVDSGKTTLAESMLFISGSIRKLGRVDHKDAFLDNYEIERARGITVFSKQAKLEISDKEITLLDTPGHVDFSSEMERTLQVMDYALLVINGKDGVQGHTQTLWKLLKKYRIPTFLFINKMDQPGTDKDVLLSNIQKNLDDKCINFNTEAESKNEFLESVALCDEKLMETYLDEGDIQTEYIIEAISERRIFPCFFGSALKLEGVEEFLKGLDKYIKLPSYSDEFGAKIYKIAYDDKNTRLTYMKITGGVLKIKDMLTNANNSNTKTDNIWSEKIDQIRIYSGNQYICEKEVYPGEICAVTGLSTTYSGEGLGNEAASEAPVLIPILTYKIIFPDNISAKDMYLKLCVLEEEDPQLHIVWNSVLEEIQIQVMGDVQIEILKTIIKERFNTDVEFGSGNIIYKETIENKVIGIGHFEPLRHYAEVQLLLEPLDRGKGLEFATNCSEDILDRNWQRLIMTHLEEKQHKGVLIGTDITDIKITLVAGRAHLKHTEGGDFRQATYRAIRQGLKTAKSILLEPVYQFRLELPQDMIGRAMSDIQKRNGSFDAPVIENGIAVLEGTAPVATMMDYQREVIAYTHGTGKYFCTLKGYQPCHNEAEILSKYDYDSEADIDNPTGSVFCSHGAGYYVNWYDVSQHAHLNIDNISESKDEVIDSEPCVNNRKKILSDEFISEEEIEQIFERTFGNLKKERNNWGKTIKPSNEQSYKGYEKTTVNTSKEEYLLVDGYNIIFSWDELKKLSEINIDSARDKLMDILCNYQGYKKNIIILVFDAYKVPRKDRDISKYQNIYVVYTKEAETADQYIEKTTHKIGNKFKVTVATSDRLEQMIVWGDGAVRLSASALREEIIKTNKEIQENLVNNRTVSDKKYLLDNASVEVKNVINEITQSNSID